MSNIFTYAPIPLKFTYTHPALFFTTSLSRFNNNGVVVSAVSTPEKKKTRKKKQPKETDPSSSSSSPSTQEKGLRFTFMEELMLKARNRDVTGVSDVIYDMVAAGLSPGPRSFHGLIVSHTLNGDTDGALLIVVLVMHLGKGECGSLNCDCAFAYCTNGHAVVVELILAMIVFPIILVVFELQSALIMETTIHNADAVTPEGVECRGLEILAAMEKLDFDIRQAWLILVEELVRYSHLGVANEVFLKGLKGGLRATDELYDLLIEEDCKAGDHSNALTISYEMEAAGRMATTFHFNCLLSVQATCGIPEIAFATFENMEYGEEFMKPDTETYNWVIQAYTRAESYDRVQDVAELLGMMVEAHKRVQPNLKTYALLVECFTKYCVVREAIRHFRALKNFEGGTRFLHNHGNFGDPLSLYLRALSREGRVVELLEALETMAKDNQPIPPRAMILSRKYRTLVSSWIEPLQEEAELGYEIDYIARFALSLSSNG
ncbi:hypothetical protein IFM89_026923 [Coptis chinensis]|uniref:Pentatricopeptide repeat-containing protein n=1 Tax=Coptis chinensis TaxID=261450 RepID=A0A835HY92_9MAGN|nr:hypothetical protein IFM89_026923 [Coptis chinensis]